MTSKQNSTEIIVRSEDYLVLRANDAEGEPVYHIDLGQCIIRYFEEEWLEFKEFASLEFDDSKTDENGIFAETENNAISYVQEETGPIYYILDMGTVSLFLTEEEYDELLNLFDEIKRL